jgi:hypothetical protein
VDSPDRVPAVLRKELMTCAAASLSGVMRVAGDPGGTIYLAGGKVAAVETPGAPSPEVLLLRSHRVTESAWDAAFAATAAVGGRMFAELVARGLVGAGELEALLLIASADAMFALASGRVDECAAEGRKSYLLPIEPGAEADWMLGEAERRMRVLASLPFPPGQARVAAAPGAMSRDARHGQGQDEILALADGRRTARDLAFALGRGVYATMLQLARMREKGLLVAVPYRAAPRTRQDTVHPSAVGQPGAPSGLPQRNKDRTGLLRRATPPAWARPTPATALQPRSGQGAETGEMT